MLNFEFKNPTKIIFGKGEIAKISREIPKTEKILFPSCAAGTVYLYFCAGRTVNFWNDPEFVFQLESDQRNA